MRADNGFDSDLIDLRARVELLEEDLSQAVHILHGWLVSIAASPESEFKRQTIRELRAKFFQLPQACPLGERLIALDEQNGRPLECEGIRLSQWVYEPRGRWNG